MISKKSDASDNSSLGWVRKQMSRNFISPLGGSNSGDDVASYGWLMECHMASYNCVAIWFNLDLIRLDSSGLNCSNKTPLLY